MRKSKQLITKLIKTQNKAQYSSDRQAAKILVLWSGNVGKVKSLAGEDFLPEKKKLLEKTATIKRFEYLPLGIEFKKQTNIAKKKKILD